MNIIWVSTLGDDGTGTGTEANPYLTVTKAASVFVTGDQIRLKAGVYNEVAPIVLSGVNGSIIADSLGVVISCDNCNIGISFITCSNIYVHNCLVKNFFSNNVYCFGIYSNELTTNIGKIEQCSIYNLSNSGTIVGAISGCFDVHHNYLSAIVGTQTCDSYGIVQYAIGGTPADTVICIVSATNFIISGITETGSDIAGTGTEANPYLTIKKAVTVFTDGDQVRVKSGIYAETGTITFSSVNGSIISESGTSLNDTDNSGNVVIAPIAGAIAISISGATRFDVQGLVIEQSSVATRVGIQLSSCTNVHITNCTIRDFISAGSYCIGILSDNTNNAGKIENCSITGIECSGLVAAGVVGNIDVVNCTIDDIVGTGTCDSFAISNLPVASLLGMFWGYTALDNNVSWQHYYATYEKYTDVLVESPHNEFGLTEPNLINRWWMRAQPYIGEDPRPVVGDEGYTHKYPRSGVHPSSQMACKVTDNSGVLHIYLAYQTYGLENVNSFDDVKIRHYNNSTNIWVDEVLPVIPWTGGSVSGRAVFGGITAININGTIHAMCVIKIFQTYNKYYKAPTSTLANLPGQLCTYIYNGTNWAIYTGGGSGSIPLYQQFSIALFNDGADQPEAWMISTTVAVSSPSVKRGIIIDKYDYVTNSWNQRTDIETGVVIPALVGWVVHPGSYTNIVGTANNLYYMSSSYIWDTNDPPAGYVVYYRHLIHFNNAGVISSPSLEISCHPTYLHYVSDTHMYMLAINRAWYDPGANREKYWPDAIQHGKFYEFDGATWNDRTIELSALPGYNAGSNCMADAFRQFIYYDENYYIILSNTNKIFIYDSGTWSYKDLHLESGLNPSKALCGLIVA